MWQVLEVAVESGGPGPLPPGDGGRGLHSGGGAETAAGHNLNHAPGVLEDRIVMRNEKRLVNHSLSTIYTLTTPPTFTPLHLTTSIYA